MATWQAAEPGTVVGDAQGNYQIRVGGQWTPMPKGSLIADDHGAYHFDSDALKPAAPKAPAQPVTNAAVGGKETTEGPVGFANGLAELVGKGLGNVPMGAVHALTQLVTGHGTDASKPPTFPLSPNAQSVGQGISDTLGQAAAPYQNPVVDAAANSDLGKNYVAPVLSKVAAVAPVAGAVSPLSDAIGPMGTAASEAASAAQAASPAGQLAAKGWQMRPSDVAKLTPGGQPTLGGGALQSIVGDRAAAQALGPQNALLAQQKAASGAGIPLTSHGLIDDAALEKAKAPHAAVYEQMANVPGETTPSAYTEAIQKLRADPTLAPETQAAVDKLVDLHSDVGNSASASQSIKTLRQKGSNLIDNDNPDLQDRGYAMKGISRALEDVLEQRAVEAGQPELASQFQQARKGYAQIMAVQDASKAGMIDPQALLKARNKGAPLSGDLADVADAAEALPDVVKHQHAFSGGAASLPTTAVGALQGIARNLGGEALLKGPYQHALRGTPAEGLGAEFGPSPATSSGGAGPLSLVDDLAAPSQQSQQSQQPLGQTPAGNKQRGNFSLRDVNKQTEVPGNGNETSGGASVEAANRGSDDYVHWNGDTANPVIGDVNQIDKLTPPKGSITINRRTGDLVSSGTTPRNLVNGLLARWKASLGQQF